MSITVKKEIIEKARTDATCEWRKQYYIEGEGLKRLETRAFEKLSDSIEYTEYRTSEDNGKTWSEWERETNTGRKVCGEDEYEFFYDSNNRDLWNPIHKHYISGKMLRIFIGGYMAAADLDYAGGRGFYDHGFIEVREGDKIYEQMVAYEEGDTVFSEETYHNDNFLKQNNSVTYQMIVLKDGDLLVGIESVPMYKICAMAGVDVNVIFPERIDDCGGFLVARGKWDNVNKRYDFTFSNPLYLAYYESTRGISEPGFVELESGDILVTMRGSNVVQPWAKKMSPYLPGYKYFSISRDGGKTFTKPTPWHFDTKEAVYSSSTYSRIFRSIKNGKVYWVGNITDPVNTYGNYPRYPLYIVEIDEVWGVAKKDTLTVIDTKAPEEHKNVQFSNFSILQNRETGDVEIVLTKLEQYADRPVFEGDVMKYTIVLPE